MVTLLRYCDLSDINIMDEASKPYLSKQWIPHCQAWTPWAWVNRVISIQNRENKLWQHYWIAQVNLFGYLKGWEEDRDTLQVFHRFDSIVVEGYCLKNSYSDVPALEQEDLDEMCEGLVAAHPARRQFFRNMLIRSYSFPTRVPRPFGDARLFNALDLYGKLNARIATIANPITQQSGQIESIIKRAESCCTKSEFLDTVRKTTALIRHRFIKRQCAKNSLEITSEEAQTLWKYLEY